MSELAVITDNSRVVMHFSIKLEDGSAADSSKVHGKPARFQMGDGNLTPNFEQHLRGLQAGDEREFTLNPEEAFGMPLDENIYQVDAAKFTAETPAEIGSIIAFTQPDGRELPGIVRAVDGNTVTVDFNHPLAGQRIVFAVEILSVENT